MSIATDAAVKQILGRLAEVEKRLAALERPTPAKPTPTPERSILGLPKFNAKH